MRGAMVAVALLLALVAGCGDEENEPQSFREQVKEQLESASPEQRERYERAGERAHERDQRQRRKRPEQQAESPDRTGGFTGVHADNYQQAKLLCRAFPPDQVAEDYGLPPGSDAVSIAEAYANGYRPGFQQANFEGCLAGLD